MSQPRLLVEAGPSLGQLQMHAVNSGIATEIKGPHFEGRVAVRIEQYLGPSAQEGQRSSPYFAAREGDMTWSIAVEGRFLEETTADDIQFGNTWEESIKASLPYGASAGIKFVQMIDPTLNADVYSDKPHAESPLLATMNYISVVKTAPNEPLPAWDDAPLHEDATALFDGEDHAELKGNPAQRKKFFGSVEHRQQTRIGPEHVISADFCNPYISFETLSLKLPVGLSFHLKPHWDGQPITFVCRSKDHSKVYFVLVFDIVEDEKSRPHAHAPVYLDAVEKTEDPLGID